FRQTEVRPQSAIGPVMDAGENRAAKVIGDTVRFLVIERHRHAAAAGPVLCGHGCLSSVGVARFGQIRPSVAASRNFRGTLSDSAPDAKTARAWPSLLNVNAAGRVWLGFPFPSPPGIPVSGRLKRQSSPGGKRLTRRGPRLARLFHDVRQEGAARALISEENSHFRWGGMPTTVCRSQL